MTALQKTPPFVNHEDVLKEIENNLRKGRSCAVVGGKWMGKTRLFYRIKDKFSHKPANLSSTSDKFTFIPIYFQPKHKHISLKEMYLQLLIETKIDILHWVEINQKNRFQTACQDLDTDYRISNVLASDEKEILRAFEGDLWEIIKVVKQNIKKPKLVFMFDGLHYDNQIPLVFRAFVEHWLELVDSNYHNKTLYPYISLIVSCLNDYVNQYIYSQNEGSNPALFSGNKTIQPIYLCVFQRTHVVEMLRYTNIEQVSDEIIDELYSLSGGHPYILNNIIEDISHDIQEYKITITLEYLQGLRSSWNHNFLEIFRWIRKCICRSEMTLAMFELLVSSPHAWQRRDLFTKLSDSSTGHRFGYELDQSLRLLQILGVVREVKSDMFEISGKLCYEYLAIYKGVEQNEVHSNNAYTALVPLREQLTELYDTVEDARRVAFEIGLDPTKIELVQKLINYWYNILVEAHKQGLVKVIVEKAKAAYPSHALILEQAYQHYQAAT